MGVAYNGLFKTLVSLLVFTILSLLTYSLWYQSTWLAPSTKLRLEHNSTVGTDLVSLFYIGKYGGGKTTTTLGRYNRLKNGRSKVNNTMRNLLTEQEHVINQSTNPRETGQSTDPRETEQTSIIHTFRKKQDEVPSNSLLQNTTRLYTPHQWYTNPSPQQLAQGPIQSYIVVLNVYEQQTMASGNLLQLQCWAKLLNLAVVKPFMKDSSLETPLDETKQASKLRMEDTFDMQHWSHYTKDEGYAPLVEWEEFVNSAPRKVIVVQAKYPTLTHVRAVRKQGLPFPHPSSQERLYAQGCKFKLVQSKGMHSLEKKGFVVVRKVCLNFLTGDELPLKQLQEHILGEHRVDKVSIIIDEWRGLGENQRVLIQEKICPEEKKYREHTKPSARIMRDADTYIKRFLQQTITGGNTNYIAVMARYEMTGLTRRSNHKDDPLAIIPDCLQKTYQELEEMKIQNKISEVFLSMDIGKYGSDSFKKKNYFGHLKDMEEFVGKVYQGGMTVREWERTFETITHTQDSGYIAMLQMVLVTRAKCILFVGGGTFQRHALHLYQDLHPDPRDRCIRIIKSCTSPYRPVEK